MTSGAEKLTQAAVQRGGGMEKMLLGKDRWPGQTQCCVDALSSQGSSEGRAAGLEAGPDVRSPGTQGVTFSLLPADGVTMCNTLVFCGPLTPRPSDLSIDPYLASS